MFLSQNKKIAVTALMLFFISFTMILFFLESGDSGKNHGQVNVLNSGHGGQELNPIGIPVEYFYRNIANYTEEPIFTVDLEGNIDYSSNDFCDLLSSDCNSLSGDAFFNYINSEDLPDFFANYSKLLRGKGVEEVLGPYRINKDNEEIIVLFHAYPILDEEDELVEFVFSVNDFTDQVHDMTIHNETDDEEEDEEIQEEDKVEDEMENEEDEEIVEEYCDDISDKEFKEEKNKKPKEEVEEEVTEEEIIEEEEVEDFEQEKEVKKKAKEKDKDKEDNGEKENEKDKDNNKDKERKNDNWIAINEWIISLGNNF